MNTIICSSPAYNFEGIFFEIHFWCGPYALTKNGRPIENRTKKFLEMYERFDKIKNKEFYRVGGGCEYL